MIIPFFPNQDKLTIQLQDQFSIVVPNNINEISTFTFLEQETWFEQDKNILHEILPTNFKAIDIGANYGFYSLFMANLQKGNSHVYSIEPCQTTMNCFKDSITTNRFTNITPLQIGLSNNKSEAFLSIQDSSELNEVVYEQNHSGNYESIQVSTLDHLYCEHNLEGCHFIKLDAEGHEAKIIKGGSKFFEKESPIVMFEIKHSDKFNLSLVNTFEELNYSIYQLDSTLNKLVKFNKDLINPLLLNVFAIPNKNIEYLKQQNTIVEFIDIKDLDSDSITNYILNHKSYHHIGFTKEVIKHSKINSPNYINALNLYATSKQSDISINERYQYLKKSYVILKSIASKEPQVAPTLSLIRVALEVKDITMALELAKYLLHEIENNQILEVNSIFLALDPKYENLDSINIKWLEEQLIYIQEMYGSYSSCFMSEESFHRTSKLLKYGSKDPLIFRKNYLCNFGKKDQHLSILLQNHPTHLNSQLWKLALA